MGKAEQKDYPNLWFRKANKITMWCFFSAHGTRPSHLTHLASRKTLPAGKIYLT
jgi:hypothetical protein